MLPLAAETAPTTTDELIAALRRGLESHGLTPRAITGEGADYPQLESLKIDLTGAEVTRENRPPKPAEAGPATVGIAHFELFGGPLYFEKTPLEVKLEADG